MEKESRIYVAGHTGLFGSALVRALEKRGFYNIIKATHRELDLTDGKATNDFFGREKPDYVFMAAAKVGGIQANNAYMADFAMENLLITCNVLKAAHETGVKKFLYLGSSCIYPRITPQPVREEYILTGVPEPTNEGYAIAKIAGVRLCDYYQKQYGDAFISCIPANVFGPYDSFDAGNNHVIPSLMDRFYRGKKAGAPSVDIWGSGKAEREFLYIDDAAEACLFVMERYSGPDTINIGTGQSTSIRELAKMVKDVVGYSGELRFDTTKPDGMPRRLLDSTKILQMGWRPTTGIKDGLKKEFEWYLTNVVKEKKSC